MELNSSIGVFVELIVKIQLYAAVRSCLEVLLFLLPLYIAWINMWQSLNTSYDSVNVHLYLIYNYFHYDFFVM